jgi:hypothetical protein
MGVGYALYMAVWFVLIDVRSDVQFVFLRNYAKTEESLENAAAAASSSPFNPSESTGAGCDRQEETPSSPQENTGSTHDAPESL